jgi:hypothetical protein
MRFVLSLLVVLLAAGCGALSAGEPFALVHSEGPADADKGMCSLGWTVRGRLVIDPNGGTAIVVDGADYTGLKVATVGDTSPVWWWPKFTGRRVGNEVEVLDPGGKVVATTGQRYSILLAFPPAGPPFVACGFGDAVTPL